MPEKRRAAASAKEKLKEVEDSARGGKDDSDEDPDFDHAAAEKEKRKQKQEETRKEKEKEKQRTSLGGGGRPGRPPGGGRSMGGGGGGGGHVGRKRPLGNNIKCPFCDEGFNTVEIVMEHMMASHENDKKYQCKMCTKSQPDTPREFPFRNNMVEHMTKEHNHQWTKRDKYDPLLEKPFSKRVKQAAKYCVIPKENATYSEDAPKPKMPRSYSNMSRTGTEKPAKIHCPHAPKCTQFFYNDDPRVLVDHVMSEHLKLHRYHCSKCGPQLTFNTHTDFTNHGKEKHKVNNPAYNDHFTDIYLVCQRVPEEAIELLNLTADDVDAIESMGRGCEDEQEEEEQEEDDDTLVVDEKWDVYMKGIRVVFQCVECDVDVEGRSGVIQHNREKHGIEL